MSNFESIKNKLSFLTSLKKTIFFEYLALKENKQHLITAIIYPVVYYLFIIKGLSKTIGDIDYMGRKIPYMLYGFTGLMGIVCIGEMSNVVYRTIIDNKWGLLQLKLLNGIQIIPYCIGKSFYSFIGIILQIPILIILYVITGGKIGMLNLLVGFLCSIIIMLFWSSLAIIIALKVTSYKIRDMILGILLLPIYFTAPTYYLLKDADLYIKFFAYINPLTYQLNGLREAMIFLRFQKSFFIMVLMTIIILFINYLMLKRIKFIRTEK